MKNKKKTTNQYIPHTCIGRANLLMGRAMVNFIDKDPTSSDSRDMRLIATRMFPDGYLVARTEKKIHAQYVKRKKAGKK